MIDLNHFIMQYSKAISEGYAAIFAGAGLTRDSGFVNWKELLAEFAEKINLDVERETDLVEVTQFFCNSNGGRGALNSQIHEKFTQYAEKNETLKRLAKLPINTFWTTNYDQLLETELKNNHKNVDVKITPESLAVVKSNRDVVIYKMHGDCDDPARCVLTKDDYESYNIHRQLFTTALQGDLVSKTFLFIGFSFDDPNLKYILSRIRVLLGENRREHYFFTKKISKLKSESKKEFLYRQNREDLQIQDLMRYGIQAVKINDYSEIPSIIDRISKCIFTKRIFVSGSCRDYGKWTIPDAYFFMNLLGRKLIENNFSLHTGLIEGVGPQITNGALTAINERKLPIDRYLHIATLPLINGNAEHMDKSTKEMFQNNMIAETGIVLFLFGNQFYNGKLEPSHGVLHDFIRAKEQKKFIIPVASTGFAAYEIYKEMKENEENYEYLKSFWNDLKNEVDPHRLCDLIIKIIKFINQWV